MLDVAAVLSASLVCLAGVMSPGPNFIAVSHRAISSSRREAFGMVLGITCVNIVWAGTALFGLGLLVTSLPGLLQVIKLMGAAYLMWFGLRLLRYSGQPLVGDRQARSVATFRSALRDGLATNLANPKSMAFYASVFADAVPADAEPATMLAMIAMVGTIAVLWYGLVAAGLSTDRMATLYRRTKATIERSCGMLLIVLGARQALS